MIRKNLSFLAAVMAIGSRYCWAATVGRGSYRYGGVKGYCHRQEGSQAQYSIAIKLTK